MSKMKLVGGMILAGCLFGSAASVRYAYSVMSKVREYDRKHGSDVMAGLSAEDIRLRDKQATAAEAKKEAEAAPGPVEAKRVWCTGGRDYATIEIGFSNRPEPQDLKRGIVLTPKVDDISFDTGSNYSWDWDDEGRYYVRLRSNSLAFRTPYKVTVKSDLKFTDGASLAGDVERTVERPDLVPDVSLLNSGRYLPSVGTRALSLETVNVSLVDCALWKVLPENIVQLLAREERQYVHSLGFWRRVSADGESTSELSTAPIAWRIDTPNRLNVVETSLLDLQSCGRELTNGVYLVGVTKGNKRADAGERDFYKEYRLVCVSDIGLSVRRDDDTLRVWTTSLASGHPLANLKVTLYAANRLVLAEAKTDANGEAVIAGWDDAYLPFALVVSDDESGDATFMAIADSMKIGEPLAKGERPSYLAAAECVAEVWTERGIYRHGEKIMTHVLVRNGEGRAPSPFPITLRLEDAEGREVSSVSVMTDAYGAAFDESFFAGENTPSGKWKIKALIPGKKGALLGEREIKIEEFVPPQVRVRLRDLPAADANVTNLSFTVAAEHLFGGAAKGITAKGLVSFTDVDFVPEGWKGFRFGDGNKGLTPNYTRTKGIFTDEKGEAKFTVAMKEAWGEPKAAVRMIVQGSVFETGGRPSVTRESRVIHKYPYYLGSDVPKYMKRALGKRPFNVARVNPDGSARQGAKTLKAELKKVSYVYNLIEKDDGDYVWDSQRMVTSVAIEPIVRLGEDGKGTVEVSLDGSGDYELTLTDEETGVSHSAAFWLSDDGDDEERASMKNPYEVAMTSDKSLYREGESPRVTLKCPFKGHAWISVMREKTLYTEVVEVTNLTQVVELKALDGSHAPNLDVAVSLVQSVNAAKNHLASRAHGILPIRVRTRESEIPVKISAAVVCAAEGGSEVTVDLEAAGEHAIAERAVVTLVDEGINLLTNEKVPDPIGFFSSERGGWHPLYDLYGKLLPVVKDGLKVNGVKTGGDDLAGMMNRVSPVPTRRFKPLSMWRVDIPLTNGVGRAKFDLPEFVGEVRVTAIAYNARGTGSTAIHEKVTPKLVMQADAPRVVAPGDKFALTLTVSNRSGEKGEVGYEIESSGAVSVEGGNKGAVTIAADDSCVINFTAKATEIGEGIITYRTKGYGENHVSVIELPVRPAVAWEEKSEVVSLKSGESVVSVNSAASSELAALTRRSFAVYTTRVAELKSAFDYLDKYPYGCLEQTTSRMFPLLNDIRGESSLPVLKAGVSRVTSMLRETDFVMWPDCTTAPWDREVSLYAAHFLVEAGERAELGVGVRTKEKLVKMLKRWAYDADTNIAVYACHNLALAGNAEKDRLYSLYDLKDKLSLLSRARLARAFVRIGEPKKARELVADAAIAPENVKEAAFALITLLELDSRDARAPKLALYLERHRDRKRFHWGTTGDNALALMALGAYHQANGVREGEAKVLGAERSEVVGEGDITLKNVGEGDAYVAIKELVLPEASAVTNEANVIHVSREFKTSEGASVDLENLTRGELIIGEITVWTDAERKLTDLVIEELLPGCLEPDRKEVAAIYADCHGVGDDSWILRSDVRDDRVIAFSSPATFTDDRESEKRKTFFYALRVITPGEFILPGTSIEAMYAPEIRARLKPEKICVKP